MTNSKNGTENKKKPWPTKDAMEQVYKLKLWGDNETAFYSGYGSHMPEIVNPYVTAVKSFLTSFQNPIKVVDLGCGDFNVGKQLVEFTDTYVAVDIVADLIAYNKQNFKADNLEFYCLDIATDKMPSGDCVLIRQVLQHLSNKEVKSILKKIRKFKYLILTEHLPIADFTPNLDIISGQGTRLKKQSGLNILAIPFNFKVIEEKQLATITLNNNKGLIVTTLYKI